MDGPAAAAAPQSATSGSSQEEEVNDECESVVVPFLGEFCSTSSSITTAVSS
jgi:hypothetical protein